MQNSVEARVIYLSIKPTQSRPTLPAEDVVELPWSVRIEKIIGFICFWQK